MLARQTRQNRTCRIHHNLPGIDGQVGVIERPVELLLRNWLVGGIVVWGKIWVSKSLASCYSRLGVENEHLLEHINGYGTISKSLAL